MPLIAKDKGGADFPPIPGGLHPAVCYAVIDIGTQASTDPRFRAKRKVVITWELPLERIDIEKEGEGKKNLPRAISQTFTLSLSDKSNLRPFLEAWRGRAFTEAELEGFDLEKLLGANGQLNIIHERKKDKTYANIASVVPASKGAKKILPENPLAFFAIEPGKKIVIPETLPQWLKGKIAFSEEYVAQQDDGTHQPAGEYGTQQEGPVDEDVPF
jgi:hypothetical protein